MGVIVVAGSPAPVPFAPTLLSPSVFSYIDLAAAQTFKWQYNPGQVGLSQTAYQFYVLVNGSGSAQYWNGSGWQSTPVWITGSPGALRQLAFSGGAWNALGGDGNFYQWTVVCQDANGTGPPANFFYFTAQAVAVVTVLTPSGTVVYADPIISWSVTFPGGASQAAYRVVIYNATQYGAGGFTPGSGPSVFDSGIVGSSAKQVDLFQIPLYLPNSTQYRAYVQVTETGGTSGQVSAWAYSSFTVSFFAPKTPGVTATATTDPITGCPMIALAVQGFDNLLSRNDSNPVASPVTWAALANCATAVTVAGLTLTSTAGGTMSAETATGTAGAVVQPSTQYTAIASLQAAVHARTCTVGIAWYNNIGTLISTSTGAGAVDNTSSPTQVSVTAFSPVNAAYAAIVVTVASTGGASEVHTLTLIALTFGTDTTWGIGGFDGLGEVILLRSDGLYVRNASIDTPAPWTSELQSVIVNDYEATPGVAYTYEAFVLVTFAANQSVLSSPGTSGSATIVSIRWWELNPLDPSTAVEAQVLSWNPQVTEQSAAHLVMGQSVPNVVANAMGGLDGNVTFETFDLDIYTGLEALLQSQQTVFISSPWGITDTGYVRFGPQSGGGSSGGGGNKVKDSSLLPSIATAPHRMTTVSWVAQNRPPV
jgi:hypothetical protein